MRLVSVDAFREEMNKVRWADMAPGFIMATENALCAAEEKTEKGILDIPRVKHYVVTLFFEGGRTTETAFKTKRSAFKYARHSVRFISNVSRATCQRVAKTRGGLVIEFYDVT